MRSSGISASNISRIGGRHQDTDIEHSRLQQKGPGTKGRPEGGADDGEGTGLH